MFTRRVSALWLWCHPDFLDIIWDLPEDSVALLCSVAGCLASVALLLGTNTTSKDLALGCDFR